jgi:hypothetical protein
MTEVLDSAVTALPALLANDSRETT